MAEEAEGEAVTEETSTGLLDNIKLEEPEAEVAADEPEHIDPASVADKPEWLPDRFYDEDKGPDYEGLAKSQQELYKKLRGGKHEAPENGEYDMKFAGDRIPEDDELMGKFKDIASERGFTQDDFESIVGMVLEAVPEEMDEPEEKHSREEELAKLGPNGEDVLNSTAKWVEGMVHKGALTAEDFGFFKDFGSTADGIRFLNRLRQNYGEKSIPVNATPDTEAMPTESELQEMVAKPEYQTDTAYRNKVVAEYKRFYGN